MNNTGEKTGYRVILLLVVGLAAFSSAMKELNQLQQLSLDASQLIAQWSDKIAPAPAEALPQTVVKLEKSCEIKQSEPSVELPWLAQETAVAPGESQQDDVEQPVLTQPAKPSAVQIAKLKKLRRLNIDPVQFEVRIPPDHDAEPDDAIISELPLSTFKAKTHKHGTIRINPRDREILLKTLSRSINLRIAS